MKCFGDKNRIYHCKVVLLDEQHLIQEIQDVTTGQDVMDVVFKHLNLLETAYFGLRYLDPNNQTHWLDPTKKVVKQLKGLSPFTLYFSVKFYAADPCKLVEEITRYQFFLQVKQDILQGRLPVSQELISELGAYAVQSELGDYDPRRHSPGYVSEFRFTTNQTVALENKIAELHSKLIGQVPAKAEYRFLEKVQWLEMYGVDLHPVLGEDNIEYFLGLTPSGVIVLRNKVKVGNYFWPRITKVYFRGRFFMLRVRDKNNAENTYGFETPSKAACKHLWQCCVEHHAFFRLTQASGNSPQAILNLGSSKLRYNGQGDKDTVDSHIPVQGRPQQEFTRTPSRRYQRRVVEGALDSPSAEDVEIPATTPNSVSTFPTTNTTTSPMYRSTSMTLGPRSDSPHSTRSAPQPSAYSVNGGNDTGREGNGRSSRQNPRGESPESVHVAVTSSLNYRVTRRTSSVDSQSSVDSRGHRRSKRKNYTVKHRRSRCRSSDGESEASSKCSNHSHRRHRHRHHSNDSDQHKHRHRRRRQKSGGSLVDSEGQWKQVQAQQAQVKGQTALVRNLSSKTSGYQNSGHDTEPDHHHHQHSSSKRRHRKHRSRSRSPSESKNTRLPNELRRHIDFSLQTPSGMTEAELRNIPYMKVETAKTIKIKYNSPKTKRHRSPRRSKSNSCEGKGANPPNDGESPPPPYSPPPITSGADAPSKPNSKRSSKESSEREREELSAQHTATPILANGTHGNLARSCSTGASRKPTCATEIQTSAASSKTSSIADSPAPPSAAESIFGSRVASSSPSPSPSPSLSTNKSGGEAKADRGHIEDSGTENYNGTSITRLNQSPSTISTSVASTHGFHQHQRKPFMLNGPSIKNLVTNTTVTSSPLRKHKNYNDVKCDYKNKSNSQVFLPESSATLTVGLMSLRSGSNAERNSHFTAILKPQASPQSSVTSGISVGSSSRDGGGVGAMGSCRRARRGSAGSLELILCPLIQSALDHQQH
ncbi:uncharacterized protein LOC143041533 isoform X2 [Oratosquilla oratoria]|uniref:uncharacterized protein LOC143041533 isoform X2 n=1 Tax=Oratosquilla oratoria TaxID=337810 RepID=UPI003F7745A3